MHSCGHMSKCYNIWQILSNGYAAFLAGLIYVCVIGGVIGSVSLISFILIERIQENL